MHDPWTDRLSEYLDGDVSDDERYAVESHLAGCPDCAAALDELKQVVERARTAGPRPPRADLWPGIAERLGGAGGGRAAPFRAREPRRVSFTLPQLAAAAVVLIAVSGGVAWRLDPSNAPGTNALGTNALGTDAAGTNAPGTFGPPGTPLDPPFTPVS